MIWSEYVVLAGSLAEQASEAARRSAVSRAYYGAFNLSRRWVEINIRPVDHRGAHQQVWEAFQRSDLASEDTRDLWKAVGAIGNDLRLLRNQADYAVELPDLERHALEAVVRAERIIALLPRLQLVT